MTDGKRGQHPIETIGEAYALGWRVLARCAGGRLDGTHSKSSRRCHYRNVQELANELEQKIVYLRERHELLTHAHRQPLSKALPVAWGLRGGRASRADEP
jgi:hypothetical protein